MSDTTSFLFGLIVGTALIICVWTACVSPDAVKVVPEIASPKPVAISEPTVAVQGQNNDTKVTTTTRIGDELVGRISTIALALVALSYPVGKIVWIITAYLLGRTFARTRKKKNANVSNANVSKNFCVEKLPRDGS